MIHSYSLYIYIKIIFLIKSILSFQQIKKMSMTFRNRIASVILFTLKDTKDTPYISPYNATRESCKLKKKKKKVDDLFVTVTSTISTIFYPLINNILSTPLISPHSIENSKKNFISQVKIIPKPLERAARRIYGIKTRSQSDPVCTVLDAIASCHEARAQWTPYANENENGRRLRTSGQMLRLTRIVLPSPSPITLLPAFFPPPISLLPPPPPRPLSFERPAKQRERERRPAIERPR